MTIFLSCMWNTKESETVFTTCIYNNIGYGHKMPHSIDTDS